MIALPGIITFLHDLFTAIWIGGLFVLVFIWFPLLKSHRDPDSILWQISMQIQIRLRIYVLISIVGLWITGILLARQNQAGGFLQFSTPYQTYLSLKHLAILSMLGMVLWRTIGMLRIQRRMKRATHPDPEKTTLPDLPNSATMETMHARSVIPVVVNLILGILVLFFTGQLAIV